MVSLTVRNVSTPNNGLKLKVWHRGSEAVVILDMRNATTLKLLLEKLVVYKENGATSEIIVDVGGGFEVKRLIELVYDQGEFWNLTIYQKGEKGVSVTLRTQELSKLYAIMSGLIN